MVSILDQSRTPPDDWLIVLRLGNYDDHAAMIGRLMSLTWTGIDLVVVKYSTSINYYSALNLTKVDVHIWALLVLFVAANWRLSARCSGYV